MQVGDLRPYLMGFFDTTVGGKKEAASYKDIASSLAVDSPDEILFATDIVEEAQAAKAAGWRSVLMTRPGNKELPAEHGFPVIDSMDKLLDAY
jgi:methylthioribulose 1-phosphate dehydratase / enolase-phosphatase E1